MGIKRTEKVKFTIGENDFYVNKFGAWYSSNLSGELVNLFTPILANIVPVAMTLMGDEKGLDTDLEKLVPALSGAFSSLSGDRVEDIMKKLLINHKNVSVAPAGCMDINKCELLTEELADELFCGEIQDMYLLFIKVIQLNYNGFFKKLANQSGLDIEKVGEKILQSKSMENLIALSSAN